MYYMYTFFHVLAKFFIFIFSSSTLNQNPHPRNAERMIENKNTVIVWHDNITANFQESVQDGQTWPTVFLSWGGGMYSTHRLYVSAISAYTGKCFYKIAKLKQLHVFFKCIWLKCSFHFSDETISCWWSIWLVFNQNKWARTKRGTVQKIVNWCFQKFGDL